MTRQDSLRGHAIYFDGQQFRYNDNHQSTIETWKNRPCGHCGLNNTPEGHDGCLGTLPGVANACCGHGVDKAAYVQYTNGTEVRGGDAIEVFEERLVMRRHERHMLGISLIIIFVAVVGLVQLIMETAK